MGSPLDRRGFLILGAGIVLAGCRSGTRAVTAPSPTPAHQPSPARSVTPKSGPTPSVRPWHPDPSDVDPSAKVAAVRTIEARGGSRSLVQVIDAQYGGILSDSACVLVVCRRWHRSRAGLRPAGGSTYDVRLIRSNGGWRVTAVHPSHPGPPAGSLTRAAREVLASPRIDLPPASRADVLSGQVHESVLTAMLTLSTRYRLGVSVVRSGHPIHVFGTSRLSDHPLGRAFDTWRIDGRMVVDTSTPRRLVEGYMEAAAAAGAYNVGGPYLLGSPPQFFSDATHHDHVHAGFTT